MAFCCICRAHVSEWLPHPNRDKRSPLMAMLGTVGSNLTRYGCPACHCNDRLRHLWLYMDKTGLATRLAGSDVLHLAPEPGLERIIADLEPATYVRGDLNPTQPGHQRLDVESLPFADETFDLAICNHVLEHVNSPMRALHELFRCLRPGGLLIAQKPFAPAMHNTLELHERPDPQTAHLLFGQEDHVRLFGGDITRYFHAAGFEGELLQHTTLLPDFSPTEYGCNEHEPFFVFWKPATHAAERANRTAGEAATVC